MPAKAPASLKKVSLDLKLVKLEWEPDHKELSVLKNLTNEVRSRRAFEVSRGIATEDPIAFLGSVQDFRKKLRKLLNDLPHTSSEARSLLLVALEWSAEILDAWHEELKKLAPNTWEFSKLEPRELMMVMERIWPKVESVRRGYDSLARSLEKYLFT